MRKLQDKVAIVTGAARGLGKGIAEKLCLEGAKVVVVDMNEDICKGTVEEFSQKGYIAASFVANIAKEVEVKDLFKFTIEKFGTVDILVNNAGINRDSTLYKMTLEDWQQVIDVNLTGTFLCTKEAAKIMKENESGKIISISSVAWQGNYGQANYSASKAGVIGLMKTASRELARNNITCNVICPGFIDTDMTRSVPDKAREIMITKIPLNRVGNPFDVANMTAYLASDEASYITGEVINVGGGLVL
ncbi:3-oxoacyl-ACP reductase FabG [Bacillus sp. EB600]|uniref:3-oxoacyl-ACP reductase FabG n=1 Tax=Bacillus sp. EB600 TaxID=2806345 RepID=UPI00210C8D07|nr:3-oxoacyl-ACP reductase FabG [Bacillus sp. EB600]MCQ6280926.1 3-oxoacyl-ACP reductase FabG [Bacillus sp. EB600]